MIALILALAAGLCAVHVAATAAPKTAAGRPAGTGDQRGQAEGLSTPQLIEQAFARGEIDAEERLLYLALALGDYDRLPEAYQGNAPWSGTLPLLELRRSLMYNGPSMDEGTAEVIRGAVSAMSSDARASLPNTFLSEHFFIEYDEIGGGLSIEAYAASLEQAWLKEIEEFGWGAPPIYPYNPPPGGRYHVRIVEFGDPYHLGHTSNQGTHAGYVGDNPFTPWEEADAYASFMSLSNDFSRFYFAAQRILDYTTAHEFNHAIQIGYGALTGANAPDKSFVEGGANWVVEEVFEGNGVASRLLWPDFERCMGAYGGDPYGYWITFRGLTERFGVGTPAGGEQVMQDFWELTSQSESSNMQSALDIALANKGTSLADAFHAYAISVRFLKRCPIAAPYCLQEADTYLSAAGEVANSGSIATANGQYEGSLEDNYAINYVGLPLGSNYAVRFENRSGGGEFRVSLVADMGNALAITAFPSLIRGGESVTLQQYRAPDEARSVAAVITNQEQTGDNPGSCTAQAYGISLEAESATEADLSVSQSDAPDPAIPGGALTYTVVVGNAGPGAATGVTMSDTLPADTSLLSATEACGEMGGIVTCALGELPAGAQETVTVTVGIPDSLTGELRNSVEVSATAVDPRPENNSSVETTVLQHRVLLPMVEGD